MKIFNSRSCGLFCIAFLLFGMFHMCGCNDPERMGRFRATPVTTVILDSLGVVDEEDAVFANARDPKVEDIIAGDDEYVIGPGDVVDISIFELFSSNLEWVGRKEVSETGRMTLPVVGTLTAAGRTELEFTEDITNVLSPGIIRDPKISVVVAMSRDRIFSISGSVPAPGQYPLNGNDFRLSDALALAGGAPQNNADFVYVIRRAEIDAAAMESTPAVEPVTDIFSVPEAPMSGSDTDAFDDIEIDEDVLPPAPMEDVDEREELLDSIAPVSLNTDSDEYLMVSLSEAVEEPEVARRGRPLRVVHDESGFRLVPADEDEEVVEAEPADDWLAGEDMGGDSDEGLGFLPPLSDEFSAGLEGTASGSGYSQEVIRIDLRELRNGNQNIVIKPGDDIQVPLNAVGVFHVMGQVSRPGPYSLTGDRLTLKQAIATAGPLSPLAWPSRCEIIRRIGPDREVTYAVNLEMLFAGTAPDVFIKANDIVNVGSHPVARWIAVVRQSFRMTYGFGFVYDRNLADVDERN